MGSMDLNANLKVQIKHFRQQVNQASDLAAELNSLLDRIRLQTTGGGPPITAEDRVGIGNGVVILVPLILVPAAVYIVVVPDVS